MGIEHNGLGVGVADNSDSTVSTEFCQIGFEFRSEISIFKAMDGSSESFLFVVEYHPRPLGTQMGVIISSIIYIVHAILFGNCPEEATHFGNSFRLVVVLKLCI